LSYYSTREIRKEVPSWLGLRRLSVLVLMQSTSTLKVQLDAASYVADIVTFALKAPSKTDESGLLYSTFSPQVCV
jgi:hypothetical protein